MKFKPSDITKEHILSAVHEIDQENINLTTGTRWEVIVNGKPYPPKEIMRYARKQYDGSLDWPNGGGPPTNDYLTKLGFEVREKGKTFINLNGHRIFKFSMGVFYKTPRYYKVNIVERLEKENLISMHENTGKSQAQLFKNTLGIGDYVYITYGKDKLGCIAKITSDVIELPSDIKNDLDEGYKGRKIEIIAQPVQPNTLDLVKHKKAWLPSANTTIKQIFNLQEANDILFSKYYNVDVRNNPETNTITTMNTTPTDKKHPLNQILYGPPGTGKTYATKELAIKIANPDFKFDKTLTDEEQRKKITDEYKRLTETGQIVFTTFHQSMSYEDFVEGIKPETLNNDVVYSTQPGLFKLLCEKAGIKSNSNFEEVLKRFKDDVTNNQPFTIHTNRSKFDVSYLGGVTFRINPHESTNDNPNYPASIENLLKFYQTESIEGIYNPSYIRGIVNHLYEKYGLIKYNTVSESPDKNHVLIIDEINRGNVSAIFGELITLLEPDKRIGATEEIKLKLPYSKNDFGVPANIYIIGTMNTADRSVEALDTALRRRFSFVEIIPDYSRIDKTDIEGINLGLLLETINDRIEALLDRDHTIGHSYFLKVKDKAALAHTFKNCIIPLLQEYFYGDYEKINLVLGDGFIRINENSNIEFAGNNPYPGYADKPKYVFPELNENNIVGAIEALKIKTV
ncbi:AAA family ATPase [Myroides ceti]|uniref:AAA family ATPase n=1 Tax=Paenimyroides ceti TaxID=395087 RepID=A0ABT8CVC5_9FLAO|nr:AAA family ATPase [Paenimyroides ceti]MDN3707603.1 AAA family ATPase [Paenimyroides ceti]